MNTKRPVSGRRRSLVLTNVDLDVGAGRLAARRRRRISRPHLKWRDCDHGARWHSDSGTSDVDWPPGTTSSIYPQPASPFCGAGVVSTWPGRSERTTLSRAIVDRWQWISDPAEGENGQSLDVDTADRIQQLRRRTTLSVVVISTCRWYHHIGQQIAHQLLYA